MCKTQRYYEQVATGDGTHDNIWTVRTTHKHGRLRTDTLPFYFDIEGAECCLTVALDDDRIISLSLRVRAAEGDVPFLPTDITPESICDWFQDNTKFEQLDPVPPELSKFADQVPQILELVRLHPDDFAGPVTNERIEALNGMLTVADTP